MNYLSLSVGLITMAIGSLAHAQGMQPVIAVTGGMSSLIKQQSQTFTFDNTIFTYQPNSSSLKPMGGIFVGAEYPFYSIWNWQTGLGLYYSVNTVKGLETQAPILNPSAIN